MFIFYEESIYATDFGVEFLSPLPHYEIISDERIIAVKTCFKIGIYRHRTEIGCRDFHK